MRSFYDNGSMPMSLIRKIAAVFCPGAVLWGRTVLSLLVAVYSLGFCAHHHPGRCPAASSFVSACCDSGADHGGGSSGMLLSASAHGCRQFHLHGTRAFELPETKMVPGGVSPSFAGELLNLWSLGTRSPAAIPGDSSDSVRSPSFSGRNLPLIS